MYDDDDDVVHNSLTWIRGLQSKWHSESVLKVLCYRRQDKRWLVSNFWIGWDEEFSSEWLYSWVDIWTDVRIEENLKVNVSFVQRDVASVGCTINIIE